jgi:hypothetical protein
VTVRGAVAICAAALTLGAGLACSETCPVAACPQAQDFDTLTCKCRPSDAGLGVEDAATQEAAAGDGAPPATVDVADTLSDPTLAGTGACSGVTLGDAVARVQADNPALADITDFVGPYPNDRERLIFAFAIPNGFRLVFKRGSGDCLGGCISNDYWYFETDTACIPQPAGSYSAQFQSAGNCFVIVGAPLWGFPSPRGPACEK